MTLDNEKIAKGCPGGSEVILYYTGHRPVSNENEHSKLKQYISWDARHLHPKTNFIHPSSALPNLCAYFTAWNIKINGEICVSAEKVFFKIYQI